MNPLLQAVTSQFNSLVKNHAQDTPLNRLHPDLKYRVTGNPLGNTNLRSYANWVDTSNTYIWVKKALQIQLNALATLPVIVANKDTNEFMPDHVLSKAFATINDYDKQMEFWSYYVVDMAIAGNFYFEVVENLNGEPLQFWRRRPDTMKVIGDTTRPAYPRVLGYKYGDNDPLTPSNVGHIKYPNAVDPFIGVGAIQAAGHSVAMDLNVQGWLEAFMLNGARPDFAIVSKEGMTQGERRDYEFEVREKFSGANNAHKFMVLEEGIDIKTFSWKPVDVQWMDQKKLDREEVGALFGIPDKLMGWGVDTYDTETKAMAALYTLWVITLNPIVKWRDTALTHYFSTVRNDLAPNEILKTDKSSVAALQLDLKYKSEITERFFKLGIPMNVLIDVLELPFPQTPEQDTPFMAKGMATVDSIINPPEPKMIAPGEDGEEDEDEDEDAPDDGEEDNKKKLAILAQRLNGNGTQKQVT